MSAAAKWGDLVFGIDFHQVITPASPNPIIFPHVFCGVVFDPLGLGISRVLGAGPVMVNGLPAASAATDVLGLGHAPMPPGSVFAPSDVPDNSGTFVTGSETVYFGGMSAGRSGSLVSSCNFPVNAPTSSAIPVPAGAPVDVGGPEAFSVAAAVMRGARTKWTSQKIHSAFRITPRTRMSKFVCTLTGHPVDVLTGEVLTDAIDFTLPGPLPLVFERNYYSNDEHAGSLGPCWHHSLEAYADETPITKGELYFELRLPDGRLASHTELDIGEDEWCHQDRYRISRDAKGYSMEFASGLKYRFEKVSKASVTHPLVRIEDRNGNAIVLRYQAGQLFEVTDSAGRVVRFSYQGKRLGMVRVTRGRELHTLVKYVYNDEKRLAGAEDPAGRPITYKYQGGVLIEEKLRNGLSFHFEYDWFHPGGYCIRTWGEGAEIEGRLYDRIITYAKEHFFTTVHDGRGGKWQYFGNGDGVVERSFDPMGVERRYEFDDFFNKTAEIVGPERGAVRRTEWGYDKRGNMIWEKNAAGRETRFTYNDQNLPVEYVDAAGFTWRKVYDERGNKLRDIDPHGNERRHRYDRRGLLVETTDALGRSSHIEYDQQGNSIADRTPSGALTRREFDDLGRMVKLIDARGIEHKFARDICGRITMTERSDGAWVREKLDAEGNVLERSDETGRVWGYAYAGMNLLAKQTDPEGGIVRLVYDGEEDLVEVINEKGESYRFERDKAGRVVREIGFDGRTIECLYDVFGQTKRITNGNGQHIKIERDVCGRLLKLTMPGRILPGEVLPSVETIEYYYDIRGEISGGKTSSAEVLLGRDACGNIVAEQINDVVIESCYDATGARVLAKTNLGHEAHFGFGKAGDLELVSFGHDPRFGDFREGALREDSRGVRAPWKAEIERDSVGSEILRRLPGNVAGVSAWDVRGKLANGNTAA